MAPRLTPPMRRALAWLVDHSDLWREQSGGGTVYVGADDVTKVRTETVEALVWRGFACRTGPNRVQATDRGRAIRREFQ